MSSDRHGGPNRAHDVNATVGARFSQGMPWQISVITSDPSGQAAATGTTSSFVVLTRIRADRLATVGATYADGSGAGPAGWTSYKELRQSFQPDHPAGTITLKPKFSAEANDGPVTLTFHFRSGARISYRITKSGITVTGSPV